jgi:hypothetical protein
MSRHNRKLANDYDLSKLPHTMPFMTDQSVHIASERTPIEQVLKLNALLGTLGIELLFVRHTLRTIPPPPSQRILWQGYTQCDGGVAQFQVRIVVFG